MKKSNLRQLKNIGQTVEKKLNEIKIFSKSDLKKVGPSKIYRKLIETNPTIHLPVCYYLYSLEGALQDKHWDDLSGEEKKRLRLKAGLKK